jgi:ubiquinone/menaquinone biosynthesis C-methylase UbiE
MDFQKHYKDHLSKFYSWMFGDFDESVARQQTLLENNGIENCKNGVAIDLGCGSGFQSLALKNLGYDVHAVDLSHELLDELKERSDSISIRHADIRDLSFAQDLKANVITCMGDTLTHLSCLEDINKLIADSYNVLESRGQLLFSYRDLSASPSDTDRFIEVRSDETRILTCFLEDRENKVRVTDLFHELSDGKWNLYKSSYHKLKIPLQFIEESMSASGFEVRVNRLPSGMLVVRGIKS